MDDSLFSKYKKKIDEYSNLKRFLIETVETETGLKLEEDEINILDKDIRLNISSTKRAFIFKSKLRDALKEKGFNLLSY